MEEKVEIPAEKNTEVNVKSISHKTCRPKVKVPYHWHWLTADLWPAVTFKRTSEQKNEPCAHVLNRAVLLSVLLAVLQYREQERFDRAGVFVCFWPANAKKKKCWIFFVFFLFATCPSHCLCVCPRYSLVLNSVKNFFRNRKKVTFSTKGLFCMSLLCFF